jgi:molybdenum cofactor guanylyltransferase
MSIDAFILAGGQSSRYGTDKALLQIDGHSVVETIALTIMEAVPGSRIRLVASADAQIMAWAFTLPVVFDLYLGRGPWSGLHAGLAYSERDWVLVTACDYPFLSSELLRFLRGMASDDVDAVVPIQHDGRPQPLCAFYRRASCLGPLEAIVTSNRPTPPLRTISELVRTREVRFEEFRYLDGSERFFTNINTPDDLHALESSASGRDSGYN